MPRGIANAAKFSLALTKVCTRSRRAHAGRHSELSGASARIMLTESPNGKRVRDPSPRRFVSELSGATVESVGHPLPATRALKKARAPDTGRDDSLIWGFDSRCTPVDPESRWSLIIGACTLIFPGDTSPAAPPALKRAFLSAASYRGLESPLPRTEVRGFHRVIANTAMIASVARIVIGRFRQLRAANDRLPDSNLTATP
jgi:hypothetical protein